MKDKAWSYYLFSAVDTCTSWRLPHKKKIMLQAPSIDWKGAQAGRLGPGGYLGVTSVPLPRSSPAQADSAADRRQRETPLQVKSLFASAFSAHRHFSCFSVICIVHQSTTHSLQTPLQAVTPLCFISSRQEYSICVSVIGIMLQPLMPSCPSTIQSCQLG